MPIDSELLPAKWMPLVRRLAGVADRECGKQGYAVMSIEVLVDPNGEPAFWSEPRIVKLESRQGAASFLREVLRLVGERVVASE